jgi:hypothetical protein
MSRGGPNSADGATKLSELFDDWGIRARMSGDDINAMRTAPSLVFDLDTQAANLPPRS